MNKEMIDGLIRTHGVTVPHENHIKIYFSDLDKVSHDIHKAFIQAQIEMLEDIKDSILGKSRSTGEARIDKHIVSLTKLLEDE